MSIFNLLLAVTLPWALLHFIRLTYLHFTHHADVTLPLTSTPGHARSTRSISDNLHFTVNTKRQEPVEIGPLWMKFETPRWNNSLSRSRLLTFLGISGQGLTNQPSSRFGQKFKRFTLMFYTIGAGVSVLVLVSGMVLLCISTLFVGWRGIEWVFGSSSAESLGGNGKFIEDHMRRLVKRAAESASHGVTNAGGAGLHSLIPGVTVPLSDLPLLVGAIALSGVIHEFGHAITAVIENIPILSTGFHIHLVLPTFFVALSQSNLSAASLPARLRTATAGAWHNFLTWLVLALLGTSAISFTGVFPLSSSTLPKDVDPFSEGVCSTTTPSCGPSAVANKRLTAIPSKVWSIFGYHNMQMKGVVVNKVDAESPLYGHLLPGSVVTRLDDVRLGGLETYGSRANGITRWYAHLSMSDEQRAKRIEEERGWCVPEDWFNRQPTACCEAESTGTNGTVHHHHSEGPASCFTSHKKVSGEVYHDETVKGQGCVDPAQLFTYQHRLAMNEQPTHPTNPKSTSGTSSKRGAAYGTRCHVACLKPDGDDESYTCVRPHMEPDHLEDRLLRLEIEDPIWLQKPLASSSSDDKKEVEKDHPFRRGFKPPPHLAPRPTRVMVYKGPTPEILDHVSVGFLLPKSRYFPPLSLPFFLRITIPTILALFLDYVGRISLSLAFFNLLPITGLDGAVVFACLLEWLLQDERNGDVAGAEQYDVELLEMGESRNSSSRNRHSRSLSRIFSKLIGRDVEKIKNVVSITTVVLGIVVTVATLWRDLA
ncbi:hypothetical protein CPB86DRAFT_694449 [Serendipita vermifera]|nr:hypothetical protein CPB86DRAFT_694449 [Serendipita vermifera]